jgi:hypothetical protein
VEADLPTSAEQIAFGSLIKGANDNLDFLLTPCTVEALRGQGRKVLIRNARPSRTINPSLCSGARMRGISIVRHWWTCVAAVAERRSIGVLRGAATTSCNAHPGNRLSAD